MILQNVEQTAAFDPLSVGIEWGFDRSMASPYLITDWVKPMELSNALHEYTHQTGMYSEMGVWYLHACWKLLAELNHYRNALPLIKREALWQAWWLTSFLLEGQAMYTQLHYLPSPTLEATAQQFDFIQAIGLDAWQLSPGPSLIDGITRLLVRACTECHEEGTKSNLLYSQTASTKPYFLGYLFFRSAQAYLASFEEALADPDLFLIFFTDFLFHNCFRHFRGSDIRDCEPIGVLFEIVEAIKRIAPKMSYLLAPIREVPRHEWNYAQVDYIASDPNHGFRKRDPMIESVKELASDIAALDEDCAGLFFESVLSLQFFHLKSLDAHIVSVGTEQRPFLSILSHSPSGGQIGGFKISNQVRAQVMQFAEHQRAQLISELPPHTRVRDISHRINDFARCEIHNIVPMNQTSSFTCLTTEYDFIMLDPRSSFRMLNDLDEAAHAQLQEKGYSDRDGQIMELKTRGRDKVIEVLQQSSFVRSRACRQRIADYYRSYLAEFERGWHEHLKLSGSRMAEFDDPQAKQVRTQQQITGWFEHFIWGDSQKSNPLAQAVVQRDLTDEFDLLCRTPPIKDQSYCLPMCSEELGDCIRSLFEDNTFISDLDYWPEATELI